MDILIRKWKREDFECFREILRDSWRDTYSAFIPLTDQKDYLNSVYNNESLEKLFCDSATEVYFAESDGKPFALLRINRQKEQNKFFINSLYVRPEYKGHGVGKRLMSFAEKEAINSGFNKVWLGVIKMNVPALNWYIKEGFKFVQEEPFKMGETVVSHLIGFKDLDNML